MINLSDVLILIIMMLLKITMKYTTTFEPATLTTV
jgi:hypothetical protein